MTFTVILRKGSDSLQFKIEATDLQGAYTIAQSKKKEIFGDVNDVTTNIIEVGTVTLGSGIIPR